MIFLGMEDGKYKYEKENGKVFLSKRRLHELGIEDPIVDNQNLIHVAKNNVATGEDIDKLSDSFSNSMNRKDKNIGEDIGNILKQSIRDTMDKDVTEKQLEEQTIKMIANLEQAGIVFQVENNKRIQKKVLSNAEEKLYNEIEVSKNKQELRLQDATYKANEFAANIYGIDSGRPKWQLALARGGANVFFMIWFIISSLTFTPIMFFLTMIGVQVKKSGLKWFFTILIYIAMLVGIWMIVVSIAGWDNIPLWPNRPSEIIKAIL